MDSEYDVYEIVSVLQDFLLIDAESYQRSYCTQSGQPLLRGYYVVNWSDDANAERFNELTSYYGPFKSRIEATLALNWLNQKWHFILDNSQKINLFKSSCGLDSI
jgi:hypothetical protein